MNAKMATEEKTFEQAGAGYVTVTTEETGGVRRREKAFSAGAIS